MGLFPAMVLQAPLWVFYRRMDFVQQRLIQAVDPVVGFVVAVALAFAVRVTGRSSAARLPAPGRRRWWRSCAPHTGCASATTAGR
jgi:hypothetical protein